jgi:hypothetical protein
MGLNWAATILVSKAMSYNIIVLENHGLRKQFRHTTVTGHGRRVIITVSGICVVPPSNLGPDRRYSFRGFLCGFPLYLKENARNRILNLDLVFSFHILSNLLFINHPVI